MRSLILRKYKKPELSESIATLLHYCNVTFITSRWNGHKVHM